MTDATSTDGSNDLRRRLLTGLAMVFAGAAVIYGTYWILALRYAESTSDAYVGGHLVMVTPQVPGTVVSIAADDTDHVAAGETLVRLDPADATVALDQAETQLAKTVRQVRNLYAGASQLRATVDVRRSELARAADDLSRRERLGKSGAVSVEDVRHARETARGAQAALEAAQHELAAAEALTDGIDVAHHPDVMNGAAHVRETYLAFARAVIRAPIGGTIAQRAVQIGAHVEPGTPLMAIAPLDQVWVDANFKEGQLINMRIGQPVTLVSDLYGSDSVFHGRVQGFAAGTGSAFALLPAQNATGNWVKVVQRIPVRIALDQAELKSHPLQIGLSMAVEIDTHDRSGDRLAREPRPQAAADIAPDATAKEADARVAAIIAANLSIDRPATGSPP